MNKNLQTKNKNLVKGTALAFATVLAAGCFPMIAGGEAVNAAVTDSTLYLLEAGDGKVDVGNTYTIRTAYLDKTAKLPVGLSSYDAGSGVEASSVTVTYVSTGEKVSVTKDEDSNIKDEVVAGKASEMTYGSFEVENVGTYVVSYSIKVDGKTYETSFEVAGVRSEASMSFESNSNVILPTVYDVTYDKAKNDNGTFKDVVLPLPNVLDKEDEKVAGVKYYTNSEAIATDTTNYVVVSVIGPKGSAVALTNDNGKIKIDGSKFNPDDAAFVGLGDFAISYKYYTKANGEAHSEAQFVNSAKKTFSVKKDYYKGYELTINQSGAVSFVTGVESAIPTISATATFENSVGAKTTESVNIKYSVKVFRDASKNSWTEEHTDKIVDGKFKAPKNGDYRFYYTVTDFYGNVKEFNNLTVAVNDTQAPTVYMYDASDASNYIDNTVGKGINEYVDASTKLASKSTANNLVIYAVGAKDNASSLNNIKLTRTISNTSSQTIQITEYAEYNLVFNYNHASLDNKTLLGKAIASKTAEEADTWLKNNKYLKVISSIDTGLKEVLAGRNVVTDENAEGYNLDTLKAELVNLGYAYIISTHTITGSTSGITYTVTYKAEDEAGKSTTSSAYSVLVVKDAFEATTAPKITFPTALAASYSKGDVITFEKPTASDEIDSRMDVVTTYQFLKADKSAAADAVNLDDKYEINLTNLPEGTAYVAINVSAENDFGLVGTFTKEVKIADINDNKVPSVLSAGILTGTMVGGKFEQNSVVNLPTIVYEDDYVAIMNSKVEIFVLDAEGKRSSKVSSYDANSKYNTWDGTYTLDTGKVIPAVAGNYELVVTVNDPAKNFISTYYYFSVESIEEDYVKINTSKSINGDGKAVVGEQFSFDIPTLSYSLKEGTKVFGLEAETNTANYYSIDFVSGPAMPTAINQTTYVAKEAGTYTFRYNVNYATYDSTKLSADEVGVYYEEAGVKYYAKEGYGALDSAIKATLVGAYKEEVATSDVMTLTVSDATSTKTYEYNFTEGEYEDSYALNDEITIFSVGADANVDKEKSTVTISYEGPTSSTRNYKLSDLETEKKYKLSGNGVYTITYKVVDINGKEYQPVNGVKSFTLRVGDSEKPEVAFKDDFVNATYNLNEELTLDLSKIVLSDNGVGAGSTAQDTATRNALLDTMKVIVSRKDDSGNWIEIENKGNAEEHIYKYKLETAGEYRVKVTVKDSVLWETTQEKTFTVSTEGKEAGVSTSTIGIILIVLSCLILVGVVAYFVIAKLRANKKGGKAASKKSNKKSK